MRKTMVAMLAVLALLGAACGGEQQEQERTPEARETPREEEAGRISITGREYSFNLPERIEGGFVNVEFRNEGRLVHEAAFIKVDPDTPQEQFVRDFKVATGEQGGPIPAYIKPYLGGNLETVRAGARATTRQSLPAGNYYLVCSLTDADSREEGAEEPERPEERALPQHFEQGMIRKVTVTGPAQVTLPQADATIAGKEYSFDVTGLKAGRNEVLFRNDGPKEIHMAAVLEFPQGVDEQAATRAIQAFAAGGEGPPPPGTPEPRDVAFSGVFDVGGGSLMEFNTTSGRVYAIVCFIQDRAGGPPHAAKNMYRVVSVR